MTQLSSANLDKAFALLVEAAVKGERCPESGTGLITKHVTRKLLNRGDIRVLIYAGNYRQVMILTGPHAGATTSSPRPGAKPWKILDGGGTRTPGSSTPPPSSGRQPSAPRFLTREELSR